VAGGSSQRMDGVDKIFAAVKGRPLLSWAVAEFENSPFADEIVIAVHRQSIQQGRALAQAEGWKKVSQVCRGGQRRQDSVREALWRLGKCDWVLVHDGARPCIDAGLIERGLEAARETGAAIPAMPVAETVKRADGRALVTETLDRRGLWLVQTPQIFRYQILWEAYKDAGEDATDDAALVERHGVPVKLFLGSAKNLKVTLPEDLELVAAYLPAHPATGSG
jgi:2-C-methyl-D-erythritol 4-phosphate cytidylyltransferase